MIFGPVKVGVGKSRDYVFGEVNLRNLGLGSAAKASLREGLLSDRFRNFLCGITKGNAFADQGFHGGGVY